MNRETFKKYLEVWNTKNYDLLDEITVEDVTRDIPAVTNRSSTDRKGMKEAIEYFHTAFPDTRVEVRDIEFVEDRSFGKFYLTGTNTGPSDLPTTGNRIEMQGMQILNYRDGKIVSEELAYDVLEYMAQLGHIQLPNAASA